MEIIWWRNIDLCVKTVTLNTESLELESFKYVLEGYMDKWTIKNVDQETRLKIKECAKTNGLTIADYLRVLVDMDVANLGEQWTIHNVDSQTVTLLIKNARNRKLTLAEYLRILANEDDSGSQAMHDLNKFNKILEKYT